MLRPRAQDVRSQDCRSRAHLESLVSPRHPPVRLPARSDWDALNERPGAYYEDAAGQPPRPIRLMAGILYLKHADSLSDEVVIERWMENLHWQAFRGEEHFEQGPPIHPTSLMRFRKRLRPAGCEELLRHYAMGPERPWPRQSSILQE